MYLTELSNLDNLYENTITASPPKGHKRTLTLVNFSKCQKRVEIIDEMLRHQYTPYQMEEKTNTVALISERLLLANRGEDWFTSKSIKHQVAEQHNQGLLDSAPLFRILKKPSRLGF